VVGPAGRQAGTQLLLSFISLGAWWCVLVRQHCTFRPAPPFAGIPAAAAAAAATVHTCCVSGCVRRVQPALHHHCTCTRAQSSAPRGRCDVVWMACDHDRCSALCDNPMNVRKNVVD
jgi:hypothetical protein